MADATTDQSPPAPAPAPAAIARSKLRYPLRSATKPTKRNNKDNAAEAPAGGGPSSTATAKRVRPPSTVRSSVSVLNVSAKEKSSSSAASRPPRRFSVPSTAKLTVSPVPRNVASPTSNGSGAATPALTPDVKKPKPETPKAAAAAATSGKKKFSVLSSVSYWLSQIKVSESAAKHKISLGFFKLALESGCEPVQRIREELKSYAVKHNVVEGVGEPAKELLHSYGIVEDLEKLKVSHEPNNNNSPNGGEPPMECRSDVVAAVSTTNFRTGRNLKPRSLNPQSPKVREAVKKDGPRTAKTPAAAAKTATRTLQNKNHVVVKAGDAAAPDGGDKHNNKTTLRRNRSSLVTSSVRKSTAIERDAPAATPVAPVSPEDVPAENKENQENHLEEAVALEITQHQQAAAA